MGGMPEASLSVATSKASKSVVEKVSSTSATAASPKLNSAKKSSLKTILVISIAGLLAVATGIFFWPHSSGSSSASVAGAPETTLALDTFVVNLDSTGQRAYLRVGITLGMSRPLKREDAPVALVRDVILSVLTGAHPDQLLAAEGKQNLKAEILKALREGAPELGINNVYFTEFLVQM